MSAHTKPRRPMRGHGPGGPMGTGEKAKDCKGTMKKMLSSMGKYKIALIFVIICAVAGTIFMIVGPKILGTATTELFNGLMNKIGGSGGIDFGRIGEILLFLLGLYIVSALFTFIQGMLMTGITQKITYRMRREISEKINRLPMNFFDKKQTGEVLSIVTNDVDTLSMSLNQSATQLITSVTTIIGILIMMFSINWIMTIVALLILPISMVIVSIIVKHSQKHFRNQQDYLGHVNGQVEETFGGVNIVQAFNNEQETIDTFEQSNEMLYKSAWKSQFLSGLMQPIMQFVGNLGYVAIAVLGGYFVINGSIAVGDIQSFIQYVRSFTQPITQVAQVSNMLQSMAAAAERVFEFLGEPEEEQVAKEHASLTETVTDSEGGRQTVTRNITISDIDGEVEFDHVHFGYNPDKIIINDFSADIKQGQ